jgi:hypothetical protein
VSITADVYSHMTADVAREAVDAMAAALYAAEAEARTTRRVREALADQAAGTTSGTTVSSPDARPHSPCTHLKDSIMNAETRPATATTRAAPWRWSRPAAPGSR